ncbi:MAG TPA: amino acid permease [Kofleriaceae bacterium]|nr:amino acid permease [Kofleriaceae bacterium]
MDRPNEGLIRGLGPWAAASIVVGTIIGTGVFLKTSVMAKTGGSAVWVLAAWGAAGLLSFTGALAYAELGGLFPRAGGEYVYLREGYGSGVAYLYAWNRFWIGTPGSIAAYAVGTATFLGDALPFGEKPIALALVVVFTAINCSSVRAGGGVQTALTALKVALIAGLAIGALGLSRAGSWARIADTGRGFPGIAAFGAMVIAALWAYDGWNNLPMAAGEVRDGSRTVPRATVRGMLGVLAIYALVNVGYFYALPFADVVSPGATSVAQRAATEFLGPAAQLVLAAAMAISAISAMHGSMLTGARVPYAVAADGLAPRGLARLGARSHVPVVAVVVQGAIACVYTLLGGFDDLTDAVVIVSWLFYGLNAGTVLLLRRRSPDAPRSFRVPGYPIVPVAFVALAFALLVDSAIVSPAITVLGAASTALGAVVYFAIARRRAPAAS